MDGQRNTTTKSIQDLGNRSHACQSIIYPPLVTSSSIASSNYQVEKDVLAQSEEKRENKGEGGEVKLGVRTHLILINNPTLPFVVISIVAIALFGNIVYRHVLQAGILGDLFTVDSLAHSRGAGDYDVGSRPHDDRENVCQSQIAASNQKECASEPYDGNDEF